MGGEEPTSPPKERHMRGGEGELHWGVKVHLCPWLFFLSHIFSATLSLIAHHSRILYYIDIRYNIEVFSESLHILYEMVCGLMLSMF